MGYLYTTLPLLSTVLGEILQEGRPGSSCPGIRGRSDEEEMAIRIQPMTTRERLHKLVDELSDAEADVTLRFAAARHEGRNLDEWGDLDAFGDALTGDTLRLLDEEERAKFGETIAEAWEHERPPT
jgi:hypothetical protein